MKINIEGSALVIIDQNLFDKYDKDTIINKIKSFNLHYIYNTIGYGVKIIESCYELLNEQAKKYDNESNHLPLIILNEKINDFLYNKELTKIKSVNDIMKELIELNTLTKFTYIELTDNLTNIIEPDELGYITVNNTTTLKISTQDFLQIEEINSFETTSFPKYEQEIEKFEFTDIIYTYLSIMNKAKGKLEKLDEFTYQINFKKYKFKILLIESINTLYNSEIDISDYELIIETNSLKINKTNILNNDLILDIYKKSIKPGIKFKE